MQVSNPYDRFEKANAINPQASDKQKVRELAPYYRANFFEILFNSVKGTILRAMQLAINSATQAAYQARLAKESISSARGEYLKFFPLYSVVLISLTFYDVFARIWRTNIFADSVERIVKSVPSSFPAPKDAQRWCDEELEKLTHEGTTDQDKRTITLNIFHVLQYTNTSLTIATEAGHIYQGQLIDYDKTFADKVYRKEDLLTELTNSFGKKEWNDTAKKVAQQFAFLGENINEEDTSGDILKAYTARKRSIERQLIANQSPNRLMDIPKTYYNITQNIVMFPIEIGMYSLTLGWQILAVMLALSVCIGGFNIWLSNKKESKKAQGDRHRDDVRTAEKDLGKNDPSYAQAICENNKTALSIKMIDIKMDMVERLFFNIFTLVLMGLCAHFLFIGRYDLAMVMAQTTSATIAFARITKYLSLYKNHNALKRTMDVYDVYKAYQQGPKTKPVETPKPATQSWGIDETIGFYLCAITISLGLLLLPMPKLVLPTITNLEVVIKTGIAVWASLAIWFKNTKESEVDASLLATTVKVLGLAFTGYYLLQATAIQQALVVLCQNSTHIAAAYGSLSLLGVGLFECFLRKPTVSILTQIGTWASQDIVSICKLPVYASSSCVNGISSLFSESKKPSPV